MRSARTRAGPCLNKKERLGSVRLYLRVPPPRAACLRDHHAVTLAHQPIIPKKSSQRVEVSRVAEWRASCKVFLFFSYGAQCYTCKRAVASAVVPSCRQAGVGKQTACILVL